MLKLCHSPYKLYSYLSKHNSYNCSYSYCYKFLLIQVPLGVLPKNETSYSDMLDILDHLQQYVPCRPTADKKDDVFLTCIAGGDQLTAARARGAKLIRENTLQSRYQLKGLLPAAEDWHAKVCLMEVISYPAKFTLTIILYYTYRWRGRGYTLQLHPWTGALYTS